MIINHNISALNTYRQMGVNQNAATSSMEKLSSGLRINKAGDDAAGLSISEKMRGQIRGLDQASRNAQDGISMIQTAEGALSENHSILQRMRELAVQSANDSNTSDDRVEIQKEINQLSSEINRIGNTTEFNTTKLIDGTSDRSSEGSAGVFTLTVSTGYAAGESFNLDGVDFKMDSDFSGADAAAQVESIAVAIQNHDQLGDKYSVKYDKGLGTLELTQKSGSFSSTKADFVQDPDNSTGVSVMAVTSAGTDSAGGITFQVGANAGQSIVADINDMRSAAINITSTSSGGTMTTTSSKTAYFTTTQDVTNGLNNSGAEYALDVSTSERASAAIDAFDDAIKSVSSERSKLGSYSNRLEHTVNNLNTVSENLTAAESRIRDVDMAKEMMDMTKENIKAQAAQAMLAQANQQPNQVLQLLR